MCSKTTEGVGAEGSRTEHGSSLLIWMITFSFSHFHSYKILVLCVRPCVCVCACVLIYWSFVPLIPSDRAPLSQAPSSVFDLVYSRLINWPFVVGCPSVSAEPLKWKWAAGSYSSAPRPRQGGDSVWTIANYQRAKSHFSAATWIKCLSLFVPSPGLVIYEPRTAERERPSHRARVISCLWLFSQH